MQIEKYIFYFNKWGRGRRGFFDQKNKNQLPDGFIKFTNPGGIIIMGRDENLTDAQWQDFEIVKRKYKSIVDILRVMICSGG